MGGVEDLMGGLVWVGWGGRLDGWTSVGGVD